MEKQKSIKRIFELFILIAVTVIAASFAYSQSWPNPGHSASHIGGGTFNGSFGDFVFPGVDLFVDGNLTVGTSRPAAKLHVQAGAIVGNKSGAGSLVAGTGVLGTGSSYGVYGRYDSDTYGYLGSSSYGVYGQYDSDRKGFIANGTYGTYGTYDSNNYGFLGGNTYGVYGKGSTYGGFFSGNALSTRHVVAQNLTSTGDLRIQASDTTLIFVDESGNVGVGTETPSVKFHVDKTSRLEGDAYFKDKVGVGTDSPDQMLKVDGSVNVTGNVSSGTGTIILDGAHNKIVGLGTNSPLSSLHVNGSTIIGNNSGAGSVPSGTGVFGSGTNSVVGKYDANTYGLLGSSSYGAYGTYGSSNARYGYLGSSNYGLYGRYDGGAFYPSGALGTADYGAYGWYDGNIQGYLGSSTRGAYGQYTSTRYGYIGGNDYGAYGQYNSSVKGYMGGSSVALGGEFNSNVKGYIGQSTQGAYGQYDSNIYGILGNGSYGAYAHYDSDTYGYMGSSAVGLYAQYNSNIKGYIGSSTYGGLAGFYDSNKKGYLGLSAYGAIGYNDSDTYGFLGNSSYGAYGQFNSTNKGYLGGSTTGAYGQYSSTRYGKFGNSTYGAYGYNYIGGGAEPIYSYGFLGSSSYGAYGFYENDNFDPAAILIGYLGSSTTGAYGQSSSTRYGKLGNSSYGAYGQYDSDTYGYLGSSTTGAYGADSTFNGKMGAFASNFFAGLEGRSSSSYGYLGFGNNVNEIYYGLVADASGSVVYGLIGSMLGGTAVRSYGDTIIRSGSVCVGTGCAYDDARDGSFITRSGYFCISDGSSTSCDDPIANVDEGEFLITDGALCIDDNGANCDDLGRTDGYIYAEDTSPNAIDIAENYPTKDKLEPGDVVFINAKNEGCSAGESSIEGCTDSGEFTPFVLKSQKPFDSSAVGIVSTNPGILLGGFWNDRFDKYSKVPIALSGRVPVKVTDENGQIEAGDFLTSSSRPGYAMKWSLLDIEDADSLDELKEILLENEKRERTIIGQALEPLEIGEGVITALVSLQ